MLEKIKIGKYREMHKKDNKVRIALFSLDDPIISFIFLCNILQKKNLKLNFIIPHGFFKH